ncbi:MAG: GGDEF domain-containing protein [Sulfuriferula sp.]
MGLDIRTIMVMLAMLTLMLAGLLELAGLHAGNVRGIRQWAIANLCVGVGLGLAYFFSAPTPGYEWAVVIGSTLIAVGIGLQFNGIQKFKEVRTDWRISALIVVAVFCLNLWYAVLAPDVGARSIANSVLYAIGYASCARALFIPIVPPLRTAYWFTAFSFSMLATVLLARAVGIWLSSPGSFAGLYTQLPVNSLLFFIASMVQLFITFGFVLMLNYRLVADMQTLASHDVLTGAFNRRSLEEEASLQWARHLRNRNAMAIMLIDIDHFKAINDQYGHQTGDEVLRRMVNIAQKTARAGDYFARFGGDEFCILLPTTTEAEALILAERLRETYEAVIMEFVGRTLKCTITIGVADSAHVGADFSSLVAAADQALYRAKQDGRNRVVSYSTLKQA